MKRIYLINDVLFKRSPIKKCILFLLYFVLVSAHIYAQNNENDFIASLMQRMTLEEKIGQLNLAVINNGVLTGTQISKDVNQKIKNGQVGGVFGTWNIERIKNLQDIAVKKSRLHIPLLFGLDVIHGHETIFPVPLALSCSWDTTLVKAVARTAAIEASADGINWVYSPMVDISRDARWGRNVEGAGEDPFLGAQMAKVMVEGYQGNNLMEDNTVMACVKHFALYGAVTAGREYNSVDMGKQEMYQYYFPPYKAAIDAGAGSVMSSFNDINGLPSAANKWLLTDVLRKQWGFNGFVVSDYGAINELTTRGLGDSKTIAALALNAGNDMEMVGDNYLGTLKKSIESGAVNIKTLDAACRRILEAKYKLGLFQNPYRNIDIKKAKTEEVTKGHLAQALETAKRTFVLLKNRNQLLPLKPQGTIAIIGPLADSKINMPGAWSVADDYHHSVTVLEGVKAELKDKATILYEKGANITDDSLLKLRVNSFKQEITTDKRTPRQMIDDAVKIAQKSDVIIAVVGEAADMTGESASRTNIGIPQSQLNLLKALHKTGKPLVAILFNGRPLTINWENEHCDALLDTWFGGFVGGSALAAGGCGD
ncbi:beta-glucosidase BglX, partial [Arachidicoccus sp.]|uniref:beta-glucosidase BglX n=1 Tax=Arachidicoccus sp. TaxID=1872624 RepID=UPI003D22DEDA